jgi:hypothetical protein
VSVCGAEPFRSTPVGGPFTSRLFGGKGSVVGASDAILFVGRLALQGGSGRTSTQQGLGWYMNGRSKGSCSF